MPVRPGVLHLSVARSEENPSEFFIIDRNNTLLGEASHIAGPFANAPLAQMALYNILLQPNFPQGIRGA